MPTYTVVATERYDRTNFYYGVFADSPEEAIEACKDAAEDESEHCEYVGWVDTDRVTDEATGKNCPTSFEAGNDL